MSTFYHLPPEVLMQIGREVHPADLVNFGVLCRKVYHSVGDSLQVHRERLQSYHTINDHSMNLYAHLGREPHLLWYVRKFVHWHDDIQIEYLHNLSSTAEEQQALLTAMREGNTVPSVKRPNKPQTDAEFVAGRMLKHSPLLTLSPQEMRVWKAQFAWLSKKELAMMTNVLTSFATNLTTMVMCATPSNSPMGFGEAACRISPLILHMNHITCAGLPMQTSTSPFSCLRELRINHGFNGFNGRRPFLLRWAQVAVLMRLPALETLSIETFGYNDNSYHCYVFTPRCSAVRHLDIGTPRAKDNIMKLLIQAPSRLESFRMRKAHIAVMGDLVEYHAETLSELNIGCRYIRGNSFVLPSLQDMSVLTSLRIDFEMLFVRVSDGKWPCLRKDYTLCSNLQGILPRSIRKIRIMKRTQDLFTQAEKPTSELLLKLASLVRARSSEFPDLQGICISKCKPDEVELPEWQVILGMRELHETCLENEVDLTTAETECTVCDLKRRWLNTDDEFVDRCAY